MNTESAVCETPKPKYILIVSQYYYSHHRFLVSADEESFREKALSLIEKLEDYKRDSGDTRPYSYGTSYEEAYLHIESRWNVNDVGDIYFIPCESFQAAIKRLDEYNSEVQLKDHYKGMKAAQRKAIEAKIFEHHDYWKIKSIVQNVFDVL